MNRLGRQAAGVAVGLVIDRAVGEPPANVHPVALFGSAMTKLERQIWRDRRDVGAAYTAVGVAIGLVAGRALRSTTAAVALACAGRELRRVAQQVEDASLDGNLDQARTLLPSLVGRDPSELDESGISAAVIESLAENTVDAVVAPAFWGFVAGAPGVLAYRAINTMDAMVGHKSARFKNFGWASARLDDAVNFIPARLFARLVQLARPDRSPAIRTAIATSASAHPSPNAGVAEAAVAGALGCELGGPLRYGDLVDVRPTLGSGPRPNAAAISTARRLVDETEQLLVAAAIGIATLSWITRAR